MVLIDGVFSGGGVKAYSFIGALESIYQRNFEFERVAGTSAGAILAAFLAAGYHYDEIYDQLNKLDLQELLDPPKITNYVPGSKWILLYFQLGLYKGKLFENWIYEQLARKGVYTFTDVPDNYLKVVVSDLTLGKLIVLPDDLNRVYGIDPKSFPISKAVRMSAGFPYFFIPEKLQGNRKTKSIIIDGGLLSNFPLWVFDQHSNKRKRPILGLKLSHSYEQIPARKISNALDMLHGLFSTMKQAHDARYVSKKDAANIVFIPVEGIDTTDFSIDDQVKRNLIAIGKQRTDKFLKTWSM